MIKECRFMEDAHLSAARNQASIPLTIDFHPVRRVSCPPFRAICFPGRHHWNYQRNDGISFRADRRSFHVSLRTCISILLRAKNHRSKEYKPKRCWSMIVKVKAWKLDVSLFSNDFDGPCRQKENGIFGWYINFPFFLSFFFFFSFFSLVSF